jgi:hypothetical protein
MALNLFFEATNALLMVTLRLEFLDRTILGILWYVPRSELVEMVLYFSEGWYVDSLVGMHSQHSIAR